MNYFTGLLVFGLLSTTTLFAQEATLDGLDGNNVPMPKQPVKRAPGSSKVDFAFSPGFIYQGQPAAEINVLAGHYESGMCAGNAFSGVRFGLETNFKSGSEHLFAPKIGVEISGMFLCMRATLLSYVSSRDIQFRFLPEIGISFLGLANLTYGYAFPLNNPQAIDLSRHRITLSINLNGKLFYDAF